MSARFALISIFVLATQGATAASPIAEQLLQEVRAKYAALGAYADTGIVIVESKPIGATMIRERLRFVTRYAQPKRFYFDATKDSGERFVIWCPGETFHSWWSATGVHEAYTPGEGVNAFAMGTLPTAGTALLISPLLFQSAGLQGPLVTMEDSRYAGVELLNGQRMHKITGSVRLNHWNENTRSTTLWIDVETLLVRKVFEDTPTGMGSSIQRTTTTLEPQLAPRLGSEAFQFRVPSGE